MSIVIVSRPPAQPPESLARPVFWTYVEVVFGLDETDALAEVAAALAAGALTSVQAVFARRQITDAQIYMRTDPQLLDIARSLGIATTQAQIDEHFRQATALVAGAST